MLWNDPKIIFIHIPKTGGSSVEHFMHRAKLNKRDGKVGQHSTLSDVKELYGDSIADYHIFTIHRNPWDRILSLYLMNYKHNNFNFPLVPEIKGRRYVSFPDFYKTITPHHTHAEDFFHYMEVDGIIPNQLQLLDFNNIEEEFTQYWKSIGREMPIPFPHVNINTRATDGLRDYLISDPEFIDIISDRYAREIEYFGYTPPKG